MGGDQEVYQAGKPFRRPWQWPRDDLAKTWVWEVHTAQEVTACFEASTIDKAKPLGESVLTEALGRGNTVLRENEEQKENKHEGLQ